MGFVRVHDKSTGHTISLSEQAAAAAGPEVVVVDPEPTDRPLPAEYDASYRGEPEPDPNMPARSASKSDWVAYAVSRGMDPSTAESQTRDGLAAHFTEES